MHPTSVGHQLLGAPRQAPGHSHEDAASVLGDRGLAGDSGGEHGIYHREKYVTGLLRPRELEQEAEHTLLRAGALSCIYCFNSQTIEQCLVGVLTNARTNDGFCC